MTLRRERDRGLPPALHALGWGILAGAPVLLAALATVVSRPNAPAGLLAQSGWAALLAGALASGAATMAARGARRAAQRLGVLSAIAAIGFCAFLGWLTSQLPARAAGSDETRPQGSAQSSRVNAS